MDAGFAVLGLLILMCVAAMPSSGRVIEKTSLTPHRKNRRRRQREVSDADYELLPQVMSDAEGRFFEVLMDAVADRADVFVKVRVADVLAPGEKHDKSDWRKAFNRISAKHFDFILCDLDTHEFLCAIELNDRSHGQSERQDRDQFLQQICDEAGLPLLQIKARAKYKQEKLEALLSMYLESQGTATKSVDSYKPIMSLYDVGT